MANWEEAITAIVKATKGSKISAAKSKKLLELWESAAKTEPDAFSQALKRSLSPEALTDVAKGNEALATALAKKPTALKRAKGVAKKQPAKTAGDIKTTEKPTALKRTKAAKAATPQTDIPQEDLVQRMQSRPEPGAIPTTPKVEEPVTADLTDLMPDAPSGKVLPESRQLTETGLDPTGWEEGSQATANKNLWDQTGKQTEASRADELYQQELNATNLPTVRGKGAGEATAFNRTAAPDETAFDPNVAEEYAKDVSGKNTALAQSPAGKNSYMSAPPEQASVYRSGRPKQLNADAASDAKGFPAPRASQVDTPDAGQAGNKVFNTKNAIKGSVAGAALLSTTTADAPALTEEAPTTEAEQPADAPTQPEEAQGPSEGKPDESTKKLNDAATDAKTAVEEIISKNPEVGEAAKKGVAEMSGFTNSAIQDLQEELAKAGDQYKDDIASLRWTQFAVGLAESLVKYAAASYGVAKKLNVAQYYNVKPMDFTQELDAIKEEYKGKVSTISQRLKQEFAAKEKAADREFSTQRDTTEFGRRQQLAQDAAAANEKVARLQSELRTEENGRRDAATMERLKLSLTNASAIAAAKNTSMQEWAKITAGNQGQTRTALDVHKAMSDIQEKTNRLQADMAKIFTQKGRAGKDAVEAYLRANNIPMPTKFFGIADDVEAAQAKAMQLIDQQGQAQMDELRSNQSIQAPLNRSERTLQDKAPEAPEAEKAPAAGLQTVDQVLKSWDTVADKSKFPPGSVYQKTVLENGVPTKKIFRVLEGGKLDVKDAIN